MRRPSSRPGGAPPGRDWPVALATGGSEGRPTPTMLVVAFAEGDPMDFSTKLDDLQQRAAEAQAAAQAAVSESREQLRQRIDQARVDLDLAAMDARQQVGEAAASAGGTWAQLKADAAAIPARFVRQLPDPARWREGQWPLPCERDGQC
jgi:hypothetical protein